MNAQSRVAVFGDKQISDQVKVELAKLGIQALDPGDLEVRDDWMVKKWFMQADPTHVFACTSVTTSLSTFTFTVVGTINVLMAAMGIAEHVRVLMHPPTIEYLTFNRLCLLFACEKNLDYALIVPKFNETLSCYVERAVLSLDASAKKAHPSSPESAKQAGEMCSQMVPEQAGNKQHGTAAKAMLETPVTATQGAASGNLCPELSAKKG